MKVKQSIRRSLAGALLILALGPLMLLGGVLTWYSFVVQQNEAVTLQKEISKRAANEIFRTIDELRRDFVSLANIYDFNTLPPMEQHRILSRLRAHSGSGHRNIVDTIAIVDASGIERDKVSERMIYVPEDFSDRSGDQAFSYPLKNNQTYYSPVWVDPATGDPFMRMGIPLRNVRTNNIIAIIIADLRLKELWNVVTEIPVGVSGNVYIVDANARVVAHRSPSVVLRGEHYEIPKSSGFNVGLSGEVASVAAESITLGDQQIYIVSEMPLVEALGLTINTVMTILAVTGIAMLASVYFGYHMVKRFIVPVESLAATAYSISNGDLSKRVEMNREDEIGVLAKAFNSMTSRLLDSIRSLEQNVKRIDHLANYDRLTGLPNRRLLENYLEKYLALSERNKTYSAVLFIDLDHFKNINDSLGHSVGDALLQQVGKRLSFEVRAEDTVARLGGDEFVIVINNIAGDLDSAKKVARNISQKLLLSLTEPYDLHGNYYRITASIGVTLGKGVSTSPDELLKHADTALYSAKDAGRNAVRFYHPSMQVIVDERLSLEKDLLAAVKGNALNVNYQPVVDKHQYMIGAEALVRWNHPERQIIMPQQFVPLAEETGLIIPIGEWVLKEACKQIKIWGDQSKGEYLEHISVNVSYRQFRQPDFVENIKRIVNDAGISANVLKLEITESVVMENVHDTVQKMKDLKNIGVRFSIDDFGTEYSSLSYLSRLPLDVLKIDQSFVHQLPKQKRGAVIVDTIIAMANHLGLAVIAEGVETEQQFDYLKKKGCRSFQGFYFSAALSPENFFELMEKNEKLRTSQPRRELALQ